MGLIVFRLPGIMMGVPSASRLLRTLLSSRVAMNNAISSTYPSASMRLCFLRKTCPSRYGLLRKLNLASTLYCCLYSPSMLLAGYLSASIRLVIKTKQLSRSRAFSTRFIMDFSLRESRLDERTAMSR